MALSFNLANCSTAVGTELEREGFILKKLKCFVSAHVGSTAKLQDVLEQEILGWEKESKKYLPECHSWKLL